MAHQSLVSLVADLLPGATAEATVKEGATTSSPGGLTLAERVTRLVNMHSIRDELRRIGNREDIAQAYLGDKRLWRERLLPLFDPLAYMARIGKDVESVCPLEHYLKSKHTIDPHPVFQTWYYLRITPSIGEFTPLEHYLQVANPLRVSPNPLFSASHFMARLPFTYPKDWNALELFLWLWPHRIVAFSPYVDHVFYAKRNPEVQESVDPLTHYFRADASTRGDLNPRFFRGWYLERYPDLAADTRDCLLHYLVEGADEGRLPNPLAANDLEALRRAFPDTSIGDLAREYLVVRNPDVYL